MEVFKILEIRDVKKQQRKYLEAIYVNASMAPVLKPNPKYCLGKYVGMTFYISYDDIENLEFKIRVRKRGEFNAFDSKPREIVVEYASLKSLINDGWELA